VEYREKPGIKSNGEKYLYLAGYVFAGWAIEGEERRKGKMNPAKD
jgi:hypothetical protein